MRVLNNPTNNDIRGFLYKRIFYNLASKDTRLFPDEVAEELKKVYPWLKEIKMTKALEGKIKEAEQRKVRVRTEREVRLARSKGSDFGGADVGPEGFVEMEEVRTGVDKDGVEWYGGIEEEFFGPSKPTF